MRKLTTVHAACARADTHVYGSDEYSPIRLQEGPVRGRNRGASIMTRESSQRVLSRWPRISRHRLRRPTLASVRFFIALSVAGCALELWNTAPLIDTALAESAQQTPLEKARTAVETLINRLRGRDMPEGIVKSNGRLEATEVDVAAKYPGRLATLTVNEGDEVTAGQVVATISSPETEAQLRGAQAQVLKAKQALAEANALIVQRKSDLDFARTDFERAKQLIEQGHVSQQVLDQRRNRFEAAEAAYVAAKAQRDQAEAAIKAAEADVERLQSILVDLVLVSPRSGRVQYRLARAGEVVAAGQRVLTILDLNDVYMTIYLPAKEAGQLTLGDEARTILDPCSPIRVPRDHQLRGDRGPVHAQERRDGRGAGEADVPSQAPGRSSRYSRNTIAR